MAGGHDAKGWEFFRGAPKRRGYALERVLVVDDSPEKHTRNYGNLVRVEPFLGDPSDDELSHLARYLPTLAKAENVRSIEKRRWRQRWQFKNKDAAD